MPGLIGSAGSANTDGNDTIVAVLDTAAKTTLNSLDTVNGGKGSNSMTLNVVGDYNDAGLPAGATVTNVQTINVRASGTLGDSAGDFNVSTVAGLNTLNVTQVSNLFGKAATTTDINVSGAAGTIMLDGGKNIVVTDATADKAITIGAATVNAGTITVTDTQMGGADIAIDGGTDVTVTVSGSNNTANSITVGSATAATGAVTVKATGAAYDVAGNTTLSNINVTGGKTISVTQVATSDAAKAASDLSAQKMVEGNITIVAAATTTDITVKQDAPVTAKNAANTTGGATTSDSVKFKDLAVGKTVILGGLTLTATVAMSATEVAAAFANLASDAAKPTDVTATTATGDTQSAAAVAKATYSGSINGWTTGAANGDTVVFTNTTPNAVKAAVSDTGDGAATTITSVATGKANDATAAGGVMGVDAGVVDITGGAALKVVSVDGYAAGAGANKVQGATNTALATVTLANGGNMTISSAAATLALSATNVNGTIDIAAGTTTLNATVNGTGTAVLASASAKAVNIVAGSGTVSDGGTALAAATAINTTGFTGSASFKIDGTVTTYTGGTGVDTVTLAAGAALSKAIDLGDGNDTLVLAADTASTTATLSGGNGIDTLSMDTTRAAALDNAPVTSFYSGFERLLISDASTATLDLANLGFTNYVTTTGSGGLLTLNNLASTGTVVMTANHTTGLTVGVTDAATGKADELNVVMTKDGILAGGTLTAANVETVKLTATDSVTTNGVGTHTLTLKADSATSLTIDGNAGLTLTLDAATTKLATIDGHGMTTGALAASANGAVVMTITGGSGADVLTASQGATSKADIINGGNGNDTLVAGDNGAHLTGGAGNDIFLLTSSSPTQGNLEANTYSYIEDFKAGDVLQLQFYDAVGTATADVTSFAKLSAVMGDTAVYSDYVAAALAQAGAGQAVWFSIGTSSYVVVDSGANTDNFVNTQDLVVKLVGVDLTNASWNADFATVAL